MKRLEIIKEAGIKGFNFEKGKGVKEATNFISRKGAVVIQILEWKVRQMELIVTIFLGTQNENRESSNSLKEFVGIFGSDITELAMQGFQQATGMMSGGKQILFQNYSGSIKMNFHAEFSGSQYYRAFILRGENEETGRQERGRKNERIR